MERTRVWRGRVRPDARDEHVRFVPWLGSGEAAVQFAKYFLAGYTLAQRGDELTVTLAAEEPLAFIRFLRNRRMWPEYWEYLGAEPSGDAEQEGDVRVRWRRAAG